MIFQKITHFRQSSLLFCNSELSLYAEKNFHFSFHRQVYCWMRNCFPAFIFSVIQATSKSDGKLFFALQFFCKASWDLQLSGLPPVVESTLQLSGPGTCSCQEYRKNLLLPGLRIPTPVESIFSCREYLQLSKVPPAVESTSTCPKYLQLSRTPPVVESTSSCPKYLQLSRAPPVVQSISSCPVVQSISSCRDHLQLSRVIPAVENTSTCPKYLQLSKVIFVRQGAS